MGRRRNRRLGGVPHQLTHPYAADGHTNRWVMSGADRPIDSAADGAAQLAGSNERRRPWIGRPRPFRAKHAGKGAAVRTGMLAAKGDLVIFTDADMATPPDQLPKLVAALRNADVALGSRIQPDGSDMRASQPPFRQQLGRIFH